MPVHHDGPLRWLARLVASRGVRLAMVAAVVIVDFTITWQGMGAAPGAIADEPGHAAIALVILGTLTRFRGTPPDPNVHPSGREETAHLDGRKLPKEPKQELTSCA
jgi:hypothetical protein